jgi:hypothetical protein
MPKRPRVANRRREAQLKREAAERYPTVPARMWTPARRLESLLTAEQEELRTSGRTMSDDDFQFRGGIAPRGESPPTACERSALQELLDHFRRPTLPARCGRGYATIDHAGGCRTNPELLADPDFNRAIRSSEH